MAEILVTGGSGQVGSYLKEFAWPQGITAFCPSRSELDISDPASIANMMAQRPFVGVINCAAYTAVDKAESDVLAAWAANALGPATLAFETGARNLPLLHVSTDYVFNGAKIGSYSPGDAVCPISVYGASKEGGEQAVRTANPRHVILRSAWIVSPRGQNFVKTMLRFGAERGHLRVVDDQHGTPTHAGDLAEALATIMLAHLRDPQAPRGTFHFTNTGETTWHGVAEQIFSTASKFGYATLKLEAIPSSQYPTPVQRPANSKLDLSTLTEIWSFRPRAWQLAVDDIVTKLLN